MSDINMLTYVSIAAILGWLVVAVLAFVKLGKSLYALWRNRSEWEEPGLPQEKTWRTYENSR